MLSYEYMAQVIWNFYGLWNFFLSILELAVYITIDIHWIETNRFDIRHSIPFHALRVWKQDCYSFIFYFKFVLWI